jgi:hypothetical protein
MSNRNIGGSLPPSSEPRILEPINTPVGIMQVRAIPEEDTHGLFDVESGELIAKHANGYSCYELAERISKGNGARARDQAIYIIAYGGKVTSFGASLLLRYALLDF